MDAENLEIVRPFGTMFSTSSSFLLTDEEVIGAGNRCSTVLYHHTALVNWHAGIHFSQLGVSI